MSAQQNTEHRGQSHPTHRVVLAGTVRVHLPVSEAFHLFTPLGEKAWADGWDPTFPAPVEGDGSNRGTVFEAAHDGDRSVWVACRCEPPRVVQYARLIPGKNAGTVTVTLATAPEGSVATVEYDLTALSDAAASDLARFAAHYPEFLVGWEVAIDKARPAATATTA